MKTSLVILIFLVTLTVKAQPSFSFNTGVMKANEGDDPYGIGSSWVPISGNNTTNSDAMVFFSDGTASVIKMTAMWEVSEIFSAGLAYRIVSWKVEKHNRSSDMNSLGALFRVNFTRNTNKVVPFFQGTFYFINDNTLTQEQAGTSPQIQPAFSISSTTSIGFDVDLGIEFILGKSWGLQLTGGFGGTQATDPDLRVNLDYGAYYSPKSVEGVFNYALTGGIKYYTGRGSKKRDF